MGSAQQRCYLFPYTPLKERNTDSAISDIGMGRKSVDLMRRDNLILILRIDLPNGANKPSRIPCQADIEIFQVPWGNNDFHEIRGERLSMEVSILTSSATGQNNRNRLQQNFGIQFQ